MSEEYEKYTKNTLASGQYVMTKEEWQRADLLDEITQLQAQLKALSWIKITPETMPKKGKKVDILLDIDGFVRVCDFVWEKSKMESAFMPHSIVYYMHQPPLPKEGE